MANNLHFEYSLSVNEKQTQQNLATFIKKTFGTDKNAKLSVPIKLDITTNLTNVDLKSIQDQLDKQFKGKLNLHATVKIDSSNVARQAQAELDKISKSLSLKVGLEVDPSAMKLMLGTVDVIKTLNKEVTKVKDNLKDLGKKIEININGAQINNVYDGALKTAEKIQKVNTQTTEEINEQLAMTKEQLAHQKKLAEEKKKELDIEKEKQANNKKIEESNKNIRKQQQQLNKELKNVEAQIVAEKKKADVLDKQAKSAKSTAKVQEDATKKIEKSTEKIAELEKQRADNQAFLQSKREEEKALLTNIELNKQEITLLRTKIKEMEKLAKATVTVTKTTGTTKTTTTQAPKKPTAKKTSNKKVVQVDTPVVQATMDATNATKARVEAENSVTQAIKKQEEVQAKSVQNQMATQDKLVQHTEDSAKKIEVAANKTYRAEDSKRTLRMPTGRDKIYNRIAGSEFASSIAGYRIHDVTSLKEQKDYEDMIYDVMVKSRGVLGTYNLELEEGVALTKEQLDYYKQILELLNSERVKALDYRGAKPNSDGKFTKAFSAWEENKDDEKLGSELDFQAEKESKIAVMRRYEKELGEEILKIEKAIGAQVRNNTESEKEALEIEIKRLQNDKKKKLNSARKDAMDEVKLYGKSKNAKVFEELVGGSSEEYDYALQKFEKQIRDVGKQLNREFMHKSFPDLLFKNIDQYFEDMEARIKEYSNALNSLEGDSKAKVENKIKSITKNMELIKGLINTYQLLDVEKAVVREAEIIDEEIEEKIGARKQALENGALGKLADPSVVNVIKTNMENFKDYVKYTQAFRKHEHATRGEVDLLLVSFDKLKDATGATGEQWDDIAKKLEKLLGVLGKTQEEVDEVTASYREADVEAKKQEEAHQNNIKQGKEMAKTLNEQIQNLEKGSDLWNRCKDAITAFNNAVKNNLDDEELDEYILKLHELSDAVMSTGKDGGDFKESNSKVKIVRKQLDTEQDITLQYEKQAKALYGILKAKEQGKKVSFDIDKVIDSQGNKWQDLAKEQEKFYRKMDDHKLWFVASHMTMNDTYADTNNLFDPANFINFNQDIEGRENIIKFLAESTAKMSILEDLQEKMDGYKPMPIAKKSDVDITNAQTKAIVEETEALDALATKQKEQQKNDEIHQKWLKNQEIAKEKEPYLQASKKLLQRMKSSNEYKKNKEDTNFVKSFENTKQYIEALKHSDFTIEQVVSAFEQLKTYAHETFHMKNETIQKLVEPFVKIEGAVAQTTEDMKKVEASVEEVAKDAQASNQATQAKAQADAKVTQEVEEQAQAQNKLKENVEATAEATEEQVKAQKQMSEELRKQLTQIIPSEVLSSIPSEMLDKMFEGVAIAVDKGIKLTKTKFKDIIGVADGLNQLDYSKALGQRGTLVAQGRKKKDGVIYNRTDEYKAQKEAMDKQVEELEKPLLDILKMMEKELKGTTTKVAKEVKKSEKQQNKTAKTENKTKQEQNKLAQQQEAISSNIDKKQSNILQTAKDILLANKEGRQYILDINSLIDDQGRTWQDIAKNSEKVYKNVKDANILYTSFENMDMNRVYGNDEQSNGIFTPTNYIDNAKYNKAKTDAERIALMSEYDGKFGILSQLESKFKDLLIAEDEATEVYQQQVVEQEKVENSLLDQIQAIEKMSNSQERFNAILEITGLNYNKILKDNVQFFKDSNEWQRDKNLQTLKMDKNYGLKIGEDKSPYNFLAYKTALPNDPNTVQGINAMGELYAIREVLTVFEEMSKKEKQKTQNEQETIETKKQENQVVQQVNQAKKEEVQIINQANEKTSQLKAELDSLEKELSNLPQTLTIEQLNKRLKEIESDPEYSSIMSNIKNQAREEVKKSGLKVTDHSVAQHMFKLLDNLLMNANYGGSSTQQVLKQYGIKDLEKFSQMNNEHEKLAGSKAYVEQVNNERKELEAKIKAKKEELALSQQINTEEEQSTSNKQKQVTVQQQVVEAKQDEFKSSKAEAEVVQKTLTLEEKKNKIIANMKMNETDMRSDDEIQYLKDEIAKIDEKTASLKAQGETLKFLNTLKMAGATKQASRLAADIMMGKENASDFGIDDKKKFADEQLAINGMLIDRADMQHQLDLQQQLIEENKAYQEELDKLNGVVKKKVEVQKEEIEVSDKLSDSSTKGLSDLKAKLEVEEQVAKTSEKTAESMKQTAKVAEYSDRRTEVYNDTIQNFLNKAKKLKDSYVGDEELARMEEEKNLLKDKIVLLQKQGETCKMLINIAQRVEKGEGSFQELQSLAYVAPDQFGVENLEQFEKEQKEIHKLQKELGDLVYKIRDEKDKPEDAQKYLEMASKEQKALREYIAEKTGANKADAVGLKQSKEQVEVIRELIVGLNDANRAIAGDGLSDLGLAKLETIMQLYQGTDGLSHASFGGLGGKYSSIIKDYDYDEEKVLNRMATDLPWDLMKYHDLYPKLEKWYKELAELAKLGDSPEYQNLNKKVQSLQKTILGLIEDIIYNLVEQPIAKVDLWDSEMIHKSMYDYHKEYGLQEVDSSKEEGDAEATALEESVKSSMRAIAEAKQSWGAIKQEVQDVAVATQEVVQDTQEIATQTQQVEESMEDTVQATKEEAKVIKEPIEDFKTLEEYQYRYRKSPRGGTEETFDSEAHLTVNHPKFSNESIGHLEAMMEMFYTKDGGVMPSYKGMALPKEVIESLGVEKLNSLLAEYAIRFHKEFQKYVQDSYARMSYARDLAEKGESIEDDHYFQKMTKAMEEFKAKLVNDAMKLIADISKSEDSVFYSNEKYDDLADYWLMEGGKGHDVSMEDRDVWNNASSQIEYLTDQEKQLQDVIQSQLTTKKQIADTTKQEKQEVQDIVDTKQEEAKATNEVKQEVQDIVDTKHEEAQVVNEVKQEVEEVKQEVETIGAKWKETYVHLSRVVEASDEFKKANLGALEAWDEIKSNTESYELDEQWKEAVDAIKDYCEELDIVLEDEEKLYEQRKQENAKTSLANTAVGEKKAADGKKLDKNGVEKDTKAKNENTKATNKNTEATNKNNKAKQENAKATNTTTDATKKSTKAKKDSTQATKEMITIEKDATKDDYRKAALEAITKVGKSNTFKKYSKDDEALKKAFADLETEAKVNKSSSAGIDYWEGLINRLRDIAAKGHVQSSTIDNAVIPYIGGTVQKSKASKQVKEMAEGKPSDTSKAVDDAKKIETSTVNTAKAQNDVAKATKVVKVDTNEVAKSTDVVKQNIAETTESMDDLKDIIVSDADINALFDGADESDEAKLSKLREQAIQAAEANKDYAKQLEEQEKSENKKASSSKKVVETKQEENKVEQQILETKEEEQDVVDDIVDTQKEVVIITQQANEIDQEKLQAMKDELNAKEKLGAEQKVQLQTLKNEIKEGEKKERAINKSIEQENKMIGKMQEKIAIAQDAEETARRENEERIKQRAEMEAHIKLLEQQADEKRQAIALLESEIEYTEDNSFQIKQLTKEYDNLQEKISETQAKVDELTDSYYEQQEQARKANNEASQQMIDEYMKRIEEEDEIRRKESAKYLPARSGEVGEYKGGGGGGNVPPSGGGNPPDGNDPDLEERIKLRQRELMLSLQQAIHNKELNDEQKMGVQILAEQILEIGQLTSSMKDLTWLSQNFRENLKEFKFSIKVDEDNKKELARIAEEERKDLVNMWAGLFDEIDANEKLKAEKQSLEELIALYKEKTLAQVDEYSAKNSNYVDSNRVSELRDMIQYMEQNISSAGEYEQVVRNIGNVFRELKFDTNQTKQWYKMEESAEKARVAQEKQAKAQQELTAKVQKHIQVKKEQAELYAKEILMSKTMQKATEEERIEMERLIIAYDFTGQSVAEVNQKYAEMQRSVKNMRLNIMNEQLMEQDTILDKLKRGIKDYVRFTLDLDDVQGVMQNVTRLFSASFENLKVLDEAYTNVRQTMDISQNEFDSMKNTAYEVGNSYGALGTDILEMVKIYAGAGVTVEEVNEKLAGTVAFQNVSGLSGTDATNALQSIINQFQLTTSKGMSAGDAITYVGDAISGVAYNLSKDEGDAMKEIISAVEDAGSVVSQAGGSLEWYSAIVGTLAENMNATGSEVGGAMRMITARTLQQKDAFEELNDSGEETEQAMANAEKALSNLGISIRGANGDLRSIEDILGDVADKWDTLSDSDQQFVAEKLAGTNRRSYFMALMEDYERVDELQTKALNSQGNMMQASEKYAESLTGKLNQLTNAQENFYQTLMNTDTMKSWIETGTNAIDMVTNLVKVMEGKWIPAIVGVTTAYVTFKMVMEGLSWSDMISSIGTVVKKLLGLKTTIEGVSMASAGLKAGLYGLIAGLAVWGVSAIVGHFKELREEFEKTGETLDTLKTGLSDFGNIDGLIESYATAREELDTMVVGSEEFLAKQEEINGLREALINADNSYAPILNGENQELETQLQLLREISFEKQKAHVQTQVDGLSNQSYYDDVAMTFNNKSANGVMGDGGLVDQYALYKQKEQELFDLQMQYADAKDAKTKQNIQEQMDLLQQDMIQQLDNFELGVENLQTDMDIIDDFNEALDIAEQYGVETDLIKVNLDGGAVAFVKGLMNALPKMREIVEGSGEFANNISAGTEDLKVAQEITPYEFKYDDNTPTKDESQKTYIESAASIEELNGYLEEMAEQGGVTQDVLEGLFNSGYLQDYNGALDDTSSIQDHVNSKIQEMEKIANDAYYNMMKDDEAFWSQKIANSEAWRDHEDTMQQDIIKLMANSLNIQANDFSDFIDSKGGMRAVDYSNASTLAQGENTMQSSLATQVLGYASQLTNGKAGYRQTDMTNVKSFLNEQGTAEAKTVQELATMWAKFYNAKVTAINNTMSEIKTRLASSYSQAALDAQDGWFGDPSKRGLEQQLKNFEKSLESLNYENLTLTNFFSSLDTYFDGVGGGVNQNWTGGKNIGTGNLKGAGSSGYKPSSSGSGSSGSGSKPSSGSGSGGSGSGSGSGSSEEEVEDMELEIDRYYELNDAITDVENALSKLQTERDKITTKSAYKKSMQQEIDLINQQIKALQNLNKEQTKERNEIKNTLSKNGFKFDSTGDITNYASRLKALQNSANSKSGAKKESAIAQVENLVELIERYNELNDNAIPETNIEIIELQNSIAELNKDLEENMKDIEALGDRYFNVSRKIASVDNALAMNKLLQENAEQERKVELMREEQKLMEQKQKYLKEQQKLAQSEANELAKQLKAEGVKLDAKGAITNYDALMKSLTDKANKLVGESQDESVEDAQELIDLINQYVELTESTIPELSQSWQEYANSIEDVNEEFGNMVVETQKDIASAYEHYLTERYNKVKEALQKEQELYNKAYDEENYKRQLDEQQRALDEIAQQIAIYSRDTSEAGKLRLQQLQREYEEQQEAINDMIRENEKSLADERFAEEQAILDEELELLTSPEHLVQVVNDAIGSGLITIGDQVLSLDGVMSNWLNDTGDGLYALGGKLKADLIDNLQNAKDIMTDMGLLKDGSISLASSQALLGSLSNTGALNNSVTFNAPLMTIEGNVDPTVMPELKQELAKLEQTILNKIAKSMK